MEEKIKEKELENEKIREFGGKMLEIIGKMDALLEKNLGKNNTKLQAWAQITPTYCYDKTEIFDISPQIGFA